LAPIDPNTVVEVFSADAGGGGYLYTRPECLSATLSNARMSSAIASAVPLEGKRVIDLGCGDGTYTRDFVTRDRVAFVLGIDPAREAIAHAERLTEASGITGCAFRRAGIDELEDTMGFDVAVLRGVLHHLEDPQAAVRKAFALAPRVVILEPNGLNPVLKLIERLSPYHRQHGERSFTPGTLAAWVRAAGGAVTTRRFINLVPFFCPAPLARMLKRFEPVAEAVPLVRAVTCGQILMVGTRAG
jgi:2-polyprenyl-3-methyl-5-hydroxy-6-metoxy-1,4-benzoquinol methylase